jgi:Cep192 domain 4/HYDIN/CFA65/VesB-like, Ig-like domain/von Willebrand factor type A domain
MPPVVVAGSLNAFQFAICDLGASPSHVLVDPAFGGNCVVAVDGVNAVAGDFTGDRLQLFDLSNPASPQPLGMIQLPFLGIGAVAILGSRVVAGHSSGGQLSLVDFTNPASPVVNTVNTGFPGFRSLAFVSSSVVVGGGLNAPPTMVRVDFTTSTKTNPNPNFVGAATVAADSTAGRIAVGNRMAGQVVIMDAAGSVLRTDTIGSLGGGTQYIGIAGTRVLAGGDNSPNVVRLVYPSGFAGAPSATVFNPGGTSGKSVAIHGTTGACGNVVGAVPTTVWIVDLGPTPPLVGPSTSPNIGGVKSLGLGILVAPPPATPSIDVAPLSLAFGPVRVNTAAKKPIRIKNVGSAPLTVSALQSSDPARFSVSLTAPFTIPPGIPPANQRDVDVSFTPNAEQSFSGQLTVDSNDASKPTIQVQLTGAGALPHAAVAPSLNVGTVAACQAVSAPLAIENTGAVQLTVSSIAATGPFSVSPAGINISGNSTQSVTVTFTPNGVVGAGNGSLTLQTDDPAKPAITVALNANATASPASMAVNPLSLDFGPVPRQFFVGLRIRVSNGSVCESLPLTLATSGAPYSVSDSETAGPGTTTIQLTIPPGAAKTFVVLFAPATLGPSAGTLTLASPGLANISVPLTGNGIDRTPAAIELVLDRSGSMADPIQVGEKMDGLKRAVKLFADVAIAGQGDEVGSVWFNHGNSILTVPGAYDAAKQGAIRTDVDTLFPMGGTGIGAALERARTELGPSALGRRVILCFTDGIETTPPWIADVKAAVLGAGIEVYAVALGKPQEISAEALSDIAASSNGKFFLTDDALRLRKNFVHVMADAFRLNIAQDPVIHLSQGQTIGLPVWITDCERRITFAVNWDNPASQIDLTVRAPDGTTFTPSSPASNLLVRYGQGSAYRYYQIALPPLDPPSDDHIGPQRSGQWVMELTGTQVAAAQERCATSVVVDSDLLLDTWIEPGNTQKPTKLRGILRHEDGRIENANVKLRVTSPTKSVSQILKQATLKKFIEQAGQEAMLGDLAGLNFVAYAVHELGRAGRFAIPRKPRTHTINVKEAEFDFLLSPPLVEGVYEFELEVEGEACGGTFERYASFSYYVRGIASSSTTTVTVNAGPPTRTMGLGAVGGFGSVTITPKTEGGVELGPGLGSRIQASVSGGEVLSIVDNLDGSYTIGVNWSVRSRKAALRLTIDDTHIDVPLTHEAAEQRGSPRRAQRPRRRRS